jgi:phosphopantothenoylcysteine decarboxylase / phosphopantothenate---cysteine ligase
MSDAPLVVLAVSGSIAAYKAVEVARLLLKRGLRVRPIMTKAATRFVGPATLAGICGQPASSDMFEAPGELHVELGAAADVVALVPATADLLAALAQGRADDLVRATALCARGRIVAAPAMHPRMWTHPATRRNLALIAADGRVRLVGPVDGEVASGDEGMGRMAEPEAIAAAIGAALGDEDLRGRRFVVSAGPTVEDLDPARFLSNRSSGKMGFAVAERAAARGADVTLVAGPVALATPFKASRVDVRSAEEMRAAINAALVGADALVMTAAVADYRPAELRQEKLKRDRDELSLELVKNPDLIAEIGARRQGASPFLVAFALETLAGEALVAAARDKLTRKKVDLVVANPAAEAFEGDTNRAILVTAEAAESLPTLDKRALADRILDRIRDALSEDER